MPRWDISPQADCSQLQLMEKRLDLQSVKSRLGELVLLDFTAYSLPEAHRLLGQHVSTQVHKILTDRLDTLPPDQIARYFDQVRVCAQVISSKMNGVYVDPHLRAALAEYMECLAAWAGGVGLRGYDHPALAPYQPLTEIELALFLQHDSAGCQSGMLRSHDGGVTLWHTEEDIEPEPGSGFDQLRIASFSVIDGESPVTISAFIYPDLLPGPAFGWRSDGYIQAADLLYIKFLASEVQAILGNIITWLALRLGASVDVQVLLQAILPTFDGYALNILRVVNEEVQADKFEFGAQYFFSHTLDNTPGAYMYQANMFTDGADPRTREIEDLLPEERGWFEGRAKNTANLLKGRRQSSDISSEMEFLLNMLTSRACGKWAYANQHVKDYFICHQTPTETELWLGAGPAFKNDHPTVIKFTI
jgi:hypothetical protein